jgi:hypothetical protein
MYQAMDKHGGVVPTNHEHNFMINIFDANTFATRRDNPPVVWLSEYHVVVYVHHVNES